MTSDEGRNKNDIKPRRFSVLRRGLLLGMPVLAGLILLLLMFADELARMGTRQTVAVPFQLPAGVEIRVAPRLVRIIGAPSGGAMAVTLGKTILVPRAPRIAAAGRPDDSPDAEWLVWNEIIRHELVHVQQRERYGRWYLPRYLLGYLRHGYSRHPLEMEAGFGTHFP